MSEGPDKLLPLDAWHRALGARMVPFAGYQMPLQYEGIIVEHLWTRDRASLFDVSHMGQLFLAGRGVETALEQLLPADLGSLEYGALRYSLLLDDNGGIIDDLIVARWRQGLYLVVNGATKSGDFAWLREKLPEGIAIRFLDDRALLALQGPKSAEVLCRHARALQAPFEPDTDVAGLNFMHGGRFMIGTVETWISRSGYTGEDGFEISLPARNAKRIADLLLTEPEVKPAGLGARDSLRLEAGLPLYGHDLDRSTSPVEAGLGFAVSRRRRVAPSFIGAPRVLRELREGAPRRRIGLSIEGRQPAREGATLHIGDRQIGIVTSGGFGPGIGAPIAMGYVEAEHSAPGTALEVEVRGKRLAVTVATLPFVPHRYHRKGAAA